MTPEEAARLIAQGEGQTTEFKASFAEERKAIETLCAFANADGGSVFLGVSREGNLQGVTIGANTLENFSNRVRAHIDPRLHPSVEILAANGIKIVVASVPKARPGDVFYAYDKPLIRVGRTNQPMSAQEQRARLVQGQDDWSEERDRPRYEVTQASVRRHESGFVPQFNVKQFSGDPVANLEWRFRGPRFPMEWRQASGAALQRTHFGATFDLSQSPQHDDTVGTDEMGFEIRFHWRGRWRSELHRWPITRRELPAKVLWDIGDELLPPLETDVE